MHTIDASDYFDGRLHNNGVETFLNIDVMLLCCRQSDFFTFILSSIFAKKVAETSGLDACLSACVFSEFYL